MGKIIELIKNFIEPKKQQSFDELAIAAGISENELKQLKNSMNGINWDSFAREEDEEKSKKRKTKNELNKEEININFSRDTLEKNKKNNEIEIEK